MKTSFPRQFGEVATSELRVHQAPASGPGCRSGLGLQSRPDETAPDLVRDDPCLIVRLITRRIHECHRPRTCPFGELVEQASLVGPPELVAVLHLKLVPSPGVMTEPLPKRVTRRQGTRPFAQLERFAAATTGPDSIDKNAVSILGQWLVVSPADANRHLAAYRIPSGLGHVGRRSQ